MNAWELGPEERDHFSVPVTQTWRSCFAQLEKIVRQAFRGLRFPSNPPLSCLVAKDVIPTVQRGTWGGKKPQALREVWNLTLVQPPTDIVIRGKFLTLPPGIFNL